MTIQHLLVSALVLIFGAACSTDDRDEQGRAQGNAQEQGKNEGSGSIKEGLEQSLGGSPSPLAAALQESRVKLQFKELCRRAPASKKFYLATQDGQREFIVYSPKHNCAKPAPVLLVLHGGFGTADGAEDVMPFQAQADKTGTWLVYPEGLNRKWNDGSVDERGQPLSNVDDVGFFNKLLDQLEDSTLVDMKRVYSTGHSNGATMSLRLICEISERIAAIGINAGALPVGLKKSCSLKHAMPILMANGTDDNSMYYEGGVGKFIEGDRLGVEDTAHFFVKLDGCSALESGKAIPNRDRYDDATSTRFVHGGCRKSVEVQHIKIQGGGHTWPGNEGSKFPILGTGNLTKDFDMSEEVMMFVSRFSL